MNRITCPELNNFTVLDGLGEIVLRIVVNGKKENKCIKYVNVINSVITSLKTMKIPFVVGFC